ncbi:MAG: hypothetical protein HYV95_13320 [Opitutae bacterium]|nr:hypothetical protein [Opitutae bacterium]
MTSPSTPPDPLDPLLDRWSAAPEPSPRLAADVWQRIAAHEGARRTPRWLAAVDAWFTRPSFAALFLVSCVLLGLFLAEVRVSRLQRERNAELARSYLQLIDPLLTAANSQPRR